MKSKSEIETIQAPANVAGVIERRVQALIHASAHDANMIRRLAMSCYWQGFEDCAAGVEAQQLKAKRLA